MKEKVAYVVCVDGNVVLFWAGGGQFGRGTVLWGEGDILSEGTFVGEHF
jgi:hypothetical protein